jgi:hypothetical protein
LSEWSPLERAVLTDGLTEAGIAYAWEAALTLAVPSEHEGDTDALVDQVRGELVATELAPADEEWGEGEVAFEALSRLFDAGDRLHQQPDDVDAAAELTEALAVVEASAPPFGFDAGLWDTARRQGHTLRQLFEDGAAQDEVAAAAAALRDVLRDHV